MRPPPLYLFYFLAFHRCSEPCNIARPVTLPRRCVQRARPTPRYHDDPPVTLELRHVKTRGATNNERPTLTRLFQGPGVRSAFINPVSQASRRSHLARVAPGNTMMIRALMIPEICRQVVTGMSAALKKAVEALLRPHRGSGVLSCTGPRHY